MEITREQRVIGGKVARLAGLMLALAPPGLASQAPGPQDRDDVERYAARLASVRQDERARAVEELVQAPALAITVTRALLAREGTTWECDESIRGCLGRLGPAAAELVPDVERRLARMPGDRARTFETVLVPLGRKGIEALARRHPPTPAEPAGPWAVIDGHASRSPDAMAFVLGGLAHAEQRVRERAKQGAQSLRTYPPKHAHSVWARLAGSPDAAVRAECLHALAVTGPLGAEAAVELARAVEGAPEAERSDACRVLARTGDAGVEQLRRIARLPDWAKRADAAIALIESGIESADALWAWLADADAGVGSAAAAGLAALGAGVVPACRARLAAGDRVESVLWVVARLDEDARPLVPELQRLARSAAAGVAGESRRILTRLGERK